ncbi:MAG: Rho termination factor N-terminal domain-containing protein, partial [Candidatus Binatia bacterium]|nr:Rho termination factor N-terminal domain-containing protein [Candidatus Binatia bacterium]
MTKDELMKQTVRELLVLARRLGLRGVSRLRKAQLIATLLETMRATPPARRRRAPTRRSTRRARAAPAGSGAYTRKELLALAKQQGLTGVSRLRKAQLLARVVGVPFSAPPVSPSLPHLSAIPAELLSPEPLGATAPQPTTADIAASAASHPPPHAAPSPARAARDQEARAVLLARDPYQLYAYWQVPAAEEQLAPLAARAGQLVVRVIAESAPDTSQDGALTTLTLPA